MEELNRQNIPPKKEGELWIERLKANAKKAFTIYSPSLWGVWTHWNGSRSEPCHREEKKCNGCKAGFPRRWKAYLHAYDQRRHGPVFIELTPTCARQLLDQVGKGITLRGLVIVLERTKANNGRLSVQLQTQGADPERLPKHLDPYDTLMNIWGLSAKREDVNERSYQGGEIIPLPEAG